MPEIDETLAERGARYGDFTDHARISQSLQAAMSTGRNWANLSDDKREALVIIAHKIARILNGDPEYADSWHDIVGYAKLAEDRCRSLPAAPVYAPTRPAATANENGWIAYAVGDRHPPTDDCSDFRLREGTEWPRQAQTDWYWTDCGPDSIAAYKLKRSPSLAGSAGGAGGSSGPSPAGGAGGSSGPSPAGGAGGSSAAAPK